MELALNLVWLLLATAALGIWYGHAQQRRHPAGRILRGVLALGCALLLFFPVISASDDLHAATAASEDFSLSARKLRSAAHQVSPGLAPAVFVALAAAILLLPDSSNSIPGQALASVGSASVSHRSVRAPPMPLFA